MLGRDAGILIPPENKHRTAEQRMRSRKPTKKTANRENPKETTSTKNMKITHNPTVPSSEIDRGGTSNFNSLY